MAQVMCMPAARVLGWVTPAMVLGGRITEPPPSMDSASPQQDTWPSLWSAQL
jgi:hypothetical protein